MCVDDNRLGWHGVPLHFRDGMLMDRDSLLLASFFVYFEMVVVTKWKFWARVRTSGWYNAPRYMGTKGGYAACKERVSCSNTCFPDTSINEWYYDRTKRKTTYVHSVHKCPFSDFPVSELTWLISTMNIMQISAVLSLLGQRLSYIVHAGYLSISVLRNKKRLMKYKALNERE